MNPDQNPIDPYSPPLVLVEAPSFAPRAELVLAGRGRRLAAVILNYLTWLIFVGIPPAICGIWNLEKKLYPILFNTIISLYVFCIIMLIAINTWLLATQGQSLGKKWMKIRIVRRDSSKASLVRILGVRGFLGGLPRAIPYIGLVYDLADALFIFHEDRECIHDKIAETKVVQV